jgi:phosphoribosyl 1,2-cyclic phosphodiesterase
MDIKTLASSSTGNCYFVSDRGETLMIECGIAIDKIKSGCNYRLSGFTGCLLSHAHMDHAKAAKDILAAGIDLYCSAGTAATLGLSGHRLHVIKAYQSLRVGRFLIHPLDARHDCAEPLGFLVVTEEEKLLFATDTFYLKDTFAGLTRIMIECNYDAATLEENIASGYVEANRRDRLLQSHMSLETCKATLQANDLSQVSEIHLIHLSFKNADAERFKREIQRLTGKRVIIAGH